LEGDVGRVDWRGFCAQFHRPPDVTMAMESLEDEANAVLLDIALTHGDSAMVTIGYLKRMIQERGVDDRYGLTLWFVERGLERLGFNAGEAHVGPGDDRRVATLVKVWRRRC
jgi:hypothetical protein